MQRIGFLTVLAMVLLAMMVAAATGCGDSNGSEKSGQSQSAEEQESSEETAGKVPASLGQVESGAEDTIDLAHGGDRAEVVRTTRALRRTAEGAVTTDLREAGVEPATHIPAPATRPAAGDSRSARRPRRGCPSRRTRYPR